jgi:hypothetical protein
MNIIATTDIRYRTTHNYDFEGRIRDIAASRDNLSSLLHEQEGDIMYEESRLGVDMRYQKSLTMRVLFEHQSLMDGNVIDNGRATTGDSTRNATGGGFVGAETNYVNLERYWLEYAFPGTPIRLFVGAEIHYGDIAGMIYDDDPRFAVYFDLGPKKELELGAWATIKRESARIGMQNDNDFVYYVFQATYKGIPQHRFGLSVVYFRDRFSGAPLISEAPLIGPGTQRPNSQGDTIPGGGLVGQKIDSVMIMPGWTGTIGPLTGLLQFNIVAGTADATNSAAACPAAAALAAVGRTACANRELDIFAWSLVAYAEVKLGLVTPFAGIIYGSGDDNAGDDKLEGFANFPIRNITGVATGLIGHLDQMKGFSSRDVTTPGRANESSTGTTAVLGGSQAFHSVSNQFNNRLGNRAHPGIGTVYSNPGTIVPFVGVKVFPMKGHEIDLAYLYRAMEDSAILSAPAAATIGGLGVPVDEALYHNLYAAWIWTLNRHFDIRLSGNIFIPAEGTKDITRTSLEGDCTVASPCEGKDPALEAAARFRARF